MTRYRETIRAALAALLVLGLLSGCAVGPPRQSDSASTATGSGAASGVRDAAKSEPQQRFQTALDLMQQGRRDEAVVALQALVRDYPQFSGPATDLGIVYAQQHRRAEAIASFSQAVKVNPRNAVAWNGLGLQYRESGDYGHAEQAYRQALAVKPDYATAALNLAILYDLSLHRPQDAVQQYRNYQQLAGSKSSPMVSVWIKEIEMASTTAGGAVVAGAQP